MRKNERDVLQILPIMEEANAYSPPGVGLPTVAHDRGHGMSIRVYCEGLYCPHWRVFSFDELAVPDELPVIHIGDVSLRKPSHRPVGLRLLMIAFERGVARRDHEELIAAKGGNDG
jgi:hypothetical protein